MKLGTETGSVVNNLFSRAVIGEPTPEVGMGCTLLGWTDRSPGTIVKVTEIGGSKLASFIIEVVEDAYKVVSGSTQDGTAAYEFTQRLEGRRSTYRKNRKTGFWDEVARNDITGKWNRTDGRGLRIGERNKYYDPSF